MSVELGFFATIDRLNPAGVWGTAIDQTLDALCGVTDKDGRPFGDFVTNLGGGVAGDRAISINCSEFVCSGEEADRITEYLNELAGYHRDGAFVIDEVIDPHSPPEPRCYGDAGSARRAWDRYFREQLQHMAGCVAPDFNFGDDAPPKTLAADRDPVTLALDLQSPTGNSPGLSVEARLDRSAVEAIYRATGVIAAELADDVGLKASATCPDEVLGEAAWRVEIDGVRLEVTPAETGVVHVSAHLDWATLREKVDAGHDPDQASEPRP